MKERLEMIGRKLLKHLDIVGIVFFAVLLGVSYLLYSQEQGWRPETVAPPPPQPITDQFVVTTEEGAEELDEEYALVMSALSAEVVAFEEDPELNIVTRVNPFNPKSIARESEAVASVQTEFREANQLFEAGDLAGAERQADEILRRVPNHRGATLLKERIDEVRAAQEAPAEEGTTEPGAAS